MQLPMHTWSTLTELSSLTFFTLSGECGQAASGSSFDKSIFTSSSYSEPGSAASRREVLFPALRREERARLFVGGENRSGRAQLRAHVRNRSALGHGKRFHALAGVFHHLAHAALDGQHAQYFQYYVLCAHAAIKRAAELHVDDFGHRQVQRAAAHGYRYVKSAGADCQHAYAAARGRMAVRAHKRLPRHAETLDVDLMADAVSRLRHIDSVL